MGVQGYLIILKSGMSRIAHRFMSKKAENNCDHSIRYGDLESMLSQRTECDSVVTM